MVTYQVDVETLLEVSLLDNKGFFFYWNIVTFIGDCKPSKLPWTAFS